MKRSDGHDEDHLGLPTTQGVGHFDEDICKAISNSLYIKDAGCMGSGTYKGGWGWKLLKMRMAEQARRRVQEI